MNKVARALSALVIGLVAVSACQGSSSGRRKDRATGGSAGEAGQGARPTGGTGATAGDAGESSGGGGGRSGGAGVSGSSGKAGAGGSSGEAGAGGEGALGGEAGAGGDGGASGDGGAGGQGGNLPACRLGPGSGWISAMAFGRDWVRFDNPKFGMDGADDDAFAGNLAANPALSPLVAGGPSDVLIGSAYQQVAAFDEILFVDIESSSNWVAISGLGVTTSLRALLSGFPEAGPTNLPAYRARIPVGASQVSRGGTWDFGNPEGALMFNACRGQDQTWSVQDECGKIGPQFTLYDSENGDPPSEPDKRHTWHALGELWDDNSMDTTQRLAYFIGPPSESGIERVHHPTLVCIR